VVGSIADEYQARLMVERLSVERKGGHQVVLALVADESADVEPVVGCPSVNTVDRYEVAEVHPDRQHLDPAKPRGEHLPTIEVRVGYPEQSATGQQRQLVPAEPDVGPDEVALEVPLR